MHTEQLSSEIRRVRHDDVFGLYVLDQRKLYKFDDFKIGGGRKKRYAIGRAQYCDVFVADPTVSQVHCFITKRRDGTFLLEDDHSTNGVYVSDVRVDRVVLTCGMHLVLGRSRFAVIGQDGSNT